MRRPEPDEPFAMLLVVPPKAISAARRHRSWNGGVGVLYADLAWADHSLWPRTENALPMVRDWPGAVRWRVGPIETRPRLVPPGNRTVPIPNPTDASAWPLARVVAASATRQIR